MSEERCGDCDFFGRNLCSVSEVRVLPKSLACPSFSNMKHLQDAITDLETQLRTVTRERDEQKALVAAKDTGGHLLPRKLWPSTPSSLPPPMR